jgi:hypothetical protein
VIIGEWYTSYLLVLPRAASCQAGRSWRSRNSQILTVAGLKVILCALHDFPFIISYKIFKKKTSTVQTMRWFVSLLSVLSLSRGAAAHGGGGIGLFGLGELSHNLVARGSELYSEGIHARDLGPRVGPFSLLERDTNQPCGWGNGSCPTGYW